MWVHHIRGLDGIVEPTACRNISFKMYGCITVEGWVASLYIHKAHQGGASRIKFNIVSQLNRILGQYKGLKGVYLFIVLPQH